jgi:hypothetical protein
MITIQTRGVLIFPFLFPIFGTEVNFADRLQVHSQTMYTRNVGKLHVLPFQGKIDTYQITIRNLAIIFKISDNVQVQ